MVRDVPEDEQIAQVLARLEHHDKGALGAYISPEERMEQQFASLLSDEERSAAEQILAAPVDDASRKATIIAVGPVVASRVLQQVLRPPRPPIGPSVRRVFPSLVFVVGDVTWLLDSIDIGRTGLTICTKIWTSWSSSLLHHDAAQHHLAIQWRGYSTINDDRGTAYSDVPGMWEAAGQVGQAGMTQLYGPLRVEFSDRQILRATLVSFQSWYPGPPAEASRLTLLPSPTIALQEPAQDGAERHVETTLGSSLAITIDLERRIV